MDPVSRPNPDNSRYSSLPEPNSKPSQQLVSYSMEYSSKVYHDFSKQRYLTIYKDICFHFDYSIVFPRLCVIPVILYLYNCSQQQIEVHYSANSNTG